MNTKPKKKHGFLKFILIVTIIIVTIVLAKKAGTYFVSKEFNTFADTYPFEFNNMDYTEYVTSDFMVVNQYTKPNGKVCVTEWSSDSDYIVIDKKGNATIKRPTSSTKTVTLTETYKKIYGKGIRTFKIVLVPEQTIYAEKVDVITKEEVANGEYNRDMAIVLKEDGNIEYMLGDFKNTYVYCEKDAFEILQAYREQFQTPAMVTFQFREINNVDITKVFWFDVFIDEYKIENGSASVVVDADTNRVKKIAISVDIGEDFVLPEGNEADFESIIADYIATNDTDNGSYEYILFELDKKIVENRLVQTYRVYYKNGAFYSVYVDVNTGEVVDYFTDMVMAERECTGYSYNLEGEKIEFDATRVESSFTGMAKVILKDTKRNIHAYNNNGLWDIMQNALGKFENQEPGLADLPLVLGAYIDKSLSMDMNAEISRETTDFTASSVRAHANAFDNMQASYDWWEKTLGRKSYDNKGAPIKLLVDTDYNVDNASWLSDEQLFMVGKAKKLVNPFGCHREVIGHEYTHAVFGQFSGGANEEVAGLNEAYADIFGCLIKGDDYWVIAETQLADGRNVYFRDLVQINRDESLGVTNPSGKTCESYKDANWNGECHTISTVISHVAYEMHASDLFSDEDVAKIWYTSLGYGYDAASTYYTCRKYVIDAAKELGYSTEKIDFIAAAFDSVGLVDPTYVYSDPKANVEDGTTDAPEVIQTKTASVPGDLILDDDVVNEYFVFYSWLAMVFGDGSGFYVYQVDNGASKAEIENLSKKLSEAMNKKYPGLNINGNDIVVEYRQVNKLSIKAMNTFLKDSDKKMKGIALDSLGLDESALETEEMQFMNVVFRLAFDWRCVETTAYDFYDEMGLIE